MENIKGKRIYLSRLIVKKEYRKQGIGNKLIEFAVNKATQFGYSEISLGVNCDNHAAYRLYLNNGFFVFETARDEYGKYYKIVREKQDKIAPCQYTITIELQLFKT